MQNNVENTLKKLNNIWYKILIFI